MKRVEYIVDTFTDYAGTKRNFVMAAVSLSDETGVGIYENGNYVDSQDKVLSIGVSVCRPNDTFNEELGKRIAEGKAVKYRNHAMYVTDAGLINDKVVKALLEQEAEYFKTNPGRYLAGYDNDARKFAETSRIEAYIEGLKGDSKTTFDYLVKASTEEIDKLTEAVDYVYYN